MARPLYEKYPIHADRYHAVLMGLARAGAKLDSDIQIIPLDHADEGDEKCIRTLEIEIKLPNVKIGRNIYTRNVAFLRIISPSSMGINLFGDGEHPHSGSGDGSFCWSSGSQVTGALRNMNYHLALVVLLGVINTYRPRDAFRQPSGALICNRDGCRRHGSRADPVLYPMGGSGLQLYHYEYVCETHSRTCYRAGCKNPVTYHVQGRDRSSCNVHSKAVCPHCLKSIGLNDLHYSFTYDGQDKLIVDVRGCKVCILKCCNGCSHIGKPETMYKVLGGMFAGGGASEPHICPTCYQTEHHYQIRQRVRNLSSEEILICRNDVKKVERNLPPRV